MSKCKREGCKRVPISQLDRPYCCSICNIEDLEKERDELKGLLKRYIEMWLNAEGVHYFDEMSMDDEKKLIEIRGKDE